MPAINTMKRKTMDCVAKLFVNGIRSDLKMVFAKCVMITHTSSMIQNASLTEDYVMMDKSSGSMADAKNARSTPE